MLQELSSELFSKKYDVINMKFLGAKTTTKVIGPRSRLSGGCSFA